MYADLQRHSCEAQLWLFLWLEGPHMSAVEVSRRGQQIAQYIKFGKSKPVLLVTKQLLQQYHDPTPHLPLLLHCA